jgi:hypothetical protein
MAKEVSVERLVDALPTDGNSMSNKRLQGQLKWSKADYHRVREEALAQRFVKKAPGHVARASRPVSCAAWHAGVQPGYQQRSNARERRRGKRESRGSQRANDPPRDKAERAMGTRTTTRGLRRSEENGTVEQHGLAWGWGRSENLLLPEQAVRFTPLELPSHSCCASFDAWPTLRMAPAER